MLTTEIIAVCSDIHKKKKHMNTHCGQSVESLGAFAKQRKVTQFSHICPSVPPYGSTRLPLDGFS